MTLRSLAPVIQGAFDAVPDVLKELQGLTMSLVDGAVSGTTIPLAAINEEDTLVAVLEFESGVPADRKSATTINTRRASGTLTLAAVVAGDTATVGGVVFTFRAAGTADPALNEVNLGANDTESAAALAAKLTLVGQNSYTATSAAAVVTIRANAEGTSGNSIATVGSTRITAGAATLAGGSATGGIKIADTTTGNKVLVVWFDKR